MHCKLQGLAFRNVRPRPLGRSPLVPRKGNQEYGTTGTRSFLLMQAAVQHCVVENAATLHPQESAPMGRAWSQGGVQKGSVLCAETFGAEIRRSPRRGFCHPGSAQGRTHRGVSRPCSGRRPVPLQVKGAHSSGQGQVAHRPCPLQPQRRNDQASNNLRGSSHAQVGRQTPKLYGEFGCGKCVLSCPHSSKASQILLQPLGAVALCQKQVHRATVRRLLCLHQTRPRAIGPRTKQHTYTCVSVTRRLLCLIQTRLRDIGVLGSNTSTPVPPLSSSRRIFPCHIAAWVDEFAQNLDERHVRSSNRSSPSWNAHAVVRRRLVDRLLLLRGSFKGATTNNRGHVPGRGHSPRATQGLLRHSDPDPVRPFGLHHLHHWQRSPTGSREEVLRTASSNARAAFPDNQESSSRRLRPPSPFLQGSHLLFVSSSTGPLSSPRSLQHTRAVQAKVFLLSSRCRQPAFLTQLFRQEPREPVRGER